MNYKAPLKAIGQVFIICAIAPATVIAMAGNNNSSSDKLVTCVACHGADGIGKAPQYPNLQGQKKEYLEKQMKQFRSGARKDPAMGAMAESLSDEDIKYIAEYYTKVR